MNQEVLKGYIQCTMDNQFEALINVISNANKGAFSYFAQQQGYVAPCCQQPRLSANTAMPKCYPRILNQAAPECSATLSWVEISMHSTNYQALVSASQPMMHQQQIDGFQKQAHMVAHQSMVQQPAPIAQQSSLGGLQPRLNQQSWPGGLQSSQLLARTQQPRSYWSQESTIQPTAYQPQVLVQQPMI
jgi:hypothetical protein